MKSISIAILAGLSLRAIADEQPNYWPLIEGYRTNHFLVQVGLDDHRRRTSNSVQRVMAGEEFQGTRYFRVRTWKDDKLQSRYTDKLLRKDATGVYSIDPDEKDTLEQIELLLPLKVGLFWMKVIKPETWTYMVLAVENVKAAGTDYKDCYHIQSVSQDGKKVEDCWLAPNIGIVKSELRSDGKIVEWTSLTKFGYKSPYLFDPASTPRPKPRK